MDEVTDFQSTISLDDFLNIKPDTMHIVAIGASAGGLEALQELFTHLDPKTGAAYVVVQHLSPHYKTVMHELLGRYTKMNVVVATDGISVEPNHLYIIPPGKNMTIADDRLLLSDIPNELGINLPIDIFFRSVAEQYLYCSIGVILSGTGSDGTRGLRAIKEAGGLIIVQDPNTAKFDGMPKSAKHNLHADFILSPSEIAKQLEKYLAHPLIRHRELSLKQTLEDKEHIMREIFNIMRRHQNIDFSYYRPSTIARRIERRMGINQITTIDDYLEILRTDPDEVAMLCKDMLIGVTRFFRDSEAFMFLAKEVVDRIVTMTEPGHEVRVWNVGCASGEESYSLAILFCESMAKHDTEIELKIFSTDADRDAIADASSGEFTEDIIQDFKSDWITKYFTYKKNIYTVKPKLRRMVIFAVHDIINDPAFSGIDLIVCRNTLIYFQHSVQKRVLSTLHYAMKRPGYLFLGSSESIGDLSPHFRVLSERFKIYEKITESRVPLSIPGPGSKSSRNLLPAISNLVKNHRTSSNKDELVKINEFLLNEYLPTTIIVNREFKIEYIYGDAGNYLNKPRPGKVSTLLSDMLVEQLRIPTSTALHRAEHDRIPFGYSDIKLNLENSAIILSLEVLPYVINDYPVYYIIFIKPKIDSQGGNDKIVDTQAYDAAQQSYQRVKELEEELVRNEKHLQLTVEELETTNEELQAANEELLVSNEELQSTNEELQSVNEELYTLNSEYQHKINELTEANGDIQNMMKSTEIGMIFLDDKLNIRRYTPNTVDFVPLVNSDLGRPFLHITNNFNYAEFTSDLDKALHVNSITERKLTLSHNNGKIFLRILPYMDEAGGTNGVVITITDVTAIENAQQRLEHAIGVLQESMYMHLSVDNQRQYEVAVLDDSSIDCENVHRLLTKHTASKFSVHTYTEINLFLHSLGEKHFDVLLLDYNLGNITASELYNTTADRLNKIAVVLMSGVKLIHDKSTEFDKFNVYDIVPKDDLSAPLLDRSIRYAVRMHEVNKFIHTVEPSRDCN